ncbi:MAG TPA: hypothetical protein VD861_21440, partial [Pyrinomonadaceae bacterium]|nr:hypothetical protein [Pyrinomonadaceae bacterium]
MRETEDGRSKELAEGRETDPRVEYARRRDARLEAAAREARRFRKVGLARISSLALGLALVWLAYGGVVAWWWWIGPAAVFFVLADVQDRISQA